MKKFVFKVSLIFVPILFGISFSLFFNEYKLFSRNGHLLLENENDYRLKFVDSNNYELYLGETVKAILPVEIIDLEETSEKIIVRTHENSVISSPISCVVNKILNDGTITLVSGKLTIKITNVISGVNEGQSILVGDLIGTANGETIGVQVFWNNRKLTLEELRALL